MYIANSNTKMQSLSDLKGAKKYAAMKTMSSAFQGMINDKEVTEMQSGRKNLQPISSMSNLMQHDEGPKTKMTFTKNKNDVAMKISGQNDSDMRTATMQRVMSARKDLTRSHKSDFFG